MMVCLAAMFIATLFGCGGGGSEPAPAATADAAAQQVVDGIRTGKPVVVWQALPASYQNDVTGIVHAVAGKLDAEMYDKIFAVLGKSKGVLRDKKDFFLNSKALPLSQGTEIEQLTANWDHAVGVVAALTDSNIATLDGLKSVDIGKLLDSSGADLMQHVIALAATSKEENPFQAMERFKFEITEKHDDGSVTMKMTDPDGHDKNEKFVQVDGKWLPKEMVDEWDEQMAEARKEIDAMDDQAMLQQKAMVMGMLAAFEVALDGLAQAESQEQFDKAVEGLMGGLMGAMMGGAMQPQP